MDRLVSRGIQAMHPADGHTAVKIRATAFSFPPFPPLSAPVFALF
jgi:hypothetical protein